MKLLLFTAVLCAALPAAAFAAAPDGNDVTTRPQAYFSTNEDGVDSLGLLPPPPEIGSVQFLLDQARYQEGLIERNTPRGAQAAKDADMGETAASFSEAFGMPISPDNTPALFALLGKMRGELGDMATRGAKRHYMRVRPYVLNNAPTCYQPDEERIKKSGSYPSGHTSLGWGYALVLAEINPANKEAILKRGYDIGQSRVICGYHWQSDVDAGRVAASAAIANLHANEEFQAMLAKAKEEFKEKKQ